VKSVGSIQHLHLKAAAIASLLTAVTILVGVQYCDRLEQEHVHATAGDFSSPKLQGAALQRHAFAAPDLLVLYGSSELIQDSTSNANRFFEDYPTGFRVFPVGKPGTTSLGILQKVAAVGKAVKDRKLAVSLSPGWFFTTAADATYYEGNFSALQAYELTFSTALTSELKHEVARRMLDYPSTLDDDWLLELALECLARNRFVDRALYRVIWPLGFVSTAIGRVQDHVEATLHVLELNDDGDPEIVHRKSRAVDWKDLLSRGVQFSHRAALKKWKAENAGRNRKLSRDKKRLQTQAFVQRISKAKEWIDLELLLRTLGELGAKPLLLSMPVENLRLDAYGVSSEARTAYRERLHQLAARYTVQLVDFQEHEVQDTFMGDFSDHLSPEGWLYYSKALDDFYHDRF
jgi:D-alanine transfer protein